MTDTLGASFARAVAAKDHARIRELLHPELDFRAMTPRRVWEAADAEELVSVLGTWFGDTDDIVALEAVEEDGFSDRDRVGYRLRIRNPDGEHLVEQQAYLSAQDGQISWLRILCSGYRPADATASVAD